MLYIKPNEPFDASYKGCIAYRKNFYVTDVKRASLIFNSLGFAKCFLNGTEVNIGKFVSPVSDYNKTLWYSRISVSDYLRVGENELLFILSGGYYNEAVKTVWKLNEQPFRDYQKLYAEIVIDGKKILTTDGTWQYTKNTPYIFSQLRCGEYYDARIEYSGWQPVVAEQKPVSLKMRRLNVEPVIEREKIFPVEVSKTDNNAFVFDFGRNIAGYLEFEGFLDAGQELVAEYAENLMDNDILNKCKCEFYFDAVIQTDRLIGNGKRIKWSPSFNYHGFRYVKVSSQRQFETGGIKAVRIMQTFATDYSFECSDAFLNSLSKMYKNSVRSNAFYMLTDCPTREKLGWFNDAFGSAECIAYFFNIKKFYKKYFQDVIDAVSENGDFPCMMPVCEWGAKTWNGMPMSAVVFDIPYQFYKVYGDSSLLKKGYKYFRKIIDFELTRVNENGLLYRGLYDWAGPYKDIFAPPTPSELTDSAIFFYCINISEITAEILCKEKDRKKYADLSATFKTRIKNRYLDSRGICTVNSQTAVAVMIRFGLYDDLKPLKTQLKTLVEKNGFHHDCGTIGLKYLYSALAICDLDSYAYRILTADGFPSYRDWYNAGETSLCESWELDSSQNHHMFSTFMKFYLERLMGIRNVGVAFDKVEIDPFFPSDMTYMKCRLKTVKGTIFIRWQKTDEKIKMIIKKPKSIEIVKTADNAEVTVMEY